MAFKIPEMVQETSFNPGSGDYTLGGAVATYRSFANEGFVAGDLTIFTAFDASSPTIFAEYYGTYRTGAARLERTTLLRSSTGSDIIWGAGATVNIVAGLPGIVLQTLFNPGLAAGYLKVASGTPNVFSTQAPPLPLADGGTNAANPAAARTSLSAMDRAMAEQSVLTTRGDLLVRGASAAVRLALGAATRFLRSDGTDPSYVALTAAMAAHTPTSPLTATDVGAALNQLSHAYSKTAQSATQDNIGTALVAISDLDNLSIPGTGDGVKVYRVSGQVTIKGLGGSGNDRQSISVHLGTAGTVADAVIATFRDVHNAAGSGADNYFTLSIPMITFVPTSSQKITIGITVVDIATVDISTATGETFCVIEQLSNA